MAEAARRVTPAQRKHIAELIRLLYVHRAQLDYPIHDVRGPADRATFRLGEQEMRRQLAGGGRLMFDCSQMVTQVLRWAGLRDPNGLGYEYAGYTGTMLHTLRHYSKPGAAGIGALVVYGPGTGEHVSIVLEPGADPLLGSHGRPGFDLVKLSAQRTWHHLPVTFLSIAELG